MHPFFQKADSLSSQVIAAAIEVHPLKGPGLIKSISKETNRGGSTLGPKAFVTSRSMESFVPFVCLVKTFVRRSQFGIVFKGLLPLNVGRCAGNGFCAASWPR